IVKPHKMELLVKDCLYYKLYYCSVCRNLVRRGNRLHAFVNSYEGTLLAMLYNEMVVQDLNPVKDRCSGLPLVKVPALPPDHEAVELGACISLLAFQIKFQDDLEDETGFWIRGYNRLLAHGFGRSFAKRHEALQKFGIDLARVRREHEALIRLEKDPAARDLDVFLDQWGRLFAYIMTQPFAGKIEATRHLALHDLFWGLGKVIYLMDSMADLNSDLQQSRFNLLYRVETEAQPESESWRREMYAKYQARLINQRDGLLGLLPAVELRESHPIVVNILTCGLDRELRKVFDNMVLKKPVSQNLLLNCQDF
ncbi:MAG: DUF5685 family protein, partial [Nitrospinaceae bacterium]